MTQDIGGIYSDGKCPLCGKKYKDDHKSALRCPDHPQHIAGRLKVKIRGICARFDNYTDAKLFLDAKREEARDGKLKLKKDQKTLGHLMDAFLDWKEKLVELGRIKPQTVNTYKNRLNRIVGKIGVARLAEDVAYNHIHDFLYDTKYTIKSKYDSYVVFKEMMILAHDMGTIRELPKFPTWQFDLEHDMQRRTTVTKEVQERILDQIWLNEGRKKPRLYLAIKFLATYINIRPNELRMVNEEDVNRELGYIIINHHKTSRTPKIVRLTHEDTESIRNLERAMPKTPFFRDNYHQRFGKNTMYRAWKRAAIQLGYKDVDLYGGTRHSSAIALYKEHGVSPEEIKKATGHKTSVAFSRYFKLDIDDIAEIHSLAQPTVKISIEEGV